MLCVQRVEQQQALSDPQSPPLQFLERAVLREREVRADAKTVLPSVQEVLIATSQLLRTLHRHVQADLCGDQRNSDTNMAARKIKRANIPSGRHYHIYRAVAIVTVAAAAWQ